MDFNPSQVKNIDAVVVHDAMRVFHLIQHSQQPIILDAATVAINSGSTIDAVRKEIERLRSANPQLNIFASVDTSVLNHYGLAGAPVVKREEKRKARAEEKKVKAEEKKVEAEAAEAKKRKRVDSVVAPTMQSKQPNFSDSDDEDEGENGAAGGQTEGHDEDVDGSVRNDWFYA